MSEYRISSVDIPWAKHCSEEYPLPLPNGISAVIPNPEGAGFIQLPYTEYRAAMGKLAIDKNVADLEPPHIQGVIDPRRQVADNPAARIEYHTESDERHYIEDAEGEQ